MSRKSDLSRRMREVIEQAKAQGWTATLRKAGHWKLSSPGGKGSVFMSQTPSDWRAVKNNLSIMRRYGFDPQLANPGRSERADRYRKAMRLAAKAFEKAQRVEDFTVAFNGALDTIKYAAVAVGEAEHSGDDPGPARKLGQNGVTEARSLLRVAQKITARYGVGPYEGNPVDIPGGSMSACLAIMEARPDVESPGGLCNWLAQRAGESVGGGIRMPKKKLKPEQRKTLRRLMRI